MPTEELTADELKAAWDGTLYWLKRSETGEWLGLHPFLFTAGLLVGIDRTGYRTRFCYQDAREAVHAILVWDGRGDPPGNWVKEKRLGLDRPNPRLLRGIPIIVEAA